MSLQPATKAAYQLLQEGSIAFSRIEAAGLRIDLPYLERAISEVKTQITQLEQAYQGSPEYKLWQKHYGNDMKLSSRVQLGHIIFDVCGHKRNPFLKDREGTIKGRAGKDKNNIAAFEHLTDKVPFIKEHQEAERLKKALVTYLYGIQRETVDGVCHPFQSLAGGFSSGEGSGGAESYRSSSSKPNFHNMPIRNKAISKIVRSCVIPRKGNVLLEPDYGTQEVRVSYCYNKDPRLKYDILNGDMHTDRMLDLYCLTPEEIGPVSSDPAKICRYVAKNRFVFAQFYGSYFAQCAPDLWDAISIFGLKTLNGTSLFEHLASRGIKRLGLCDPDCEPIKGTFEYHVRDVERKMWQESYPVYDQWKRDWWNLYQQQGGINTLTGFRQYGVFRRNQILCDAIQGSAFQCLLWSIIEIQKELIRQKMRTRIIDQVHDSALFDAPREEVDGVIEIANDTMLKKVAKHWPWICIPLSVEWDWSESSWYDKKPLRV